MQDFRKLRVWRAAHEAALGVYRVTASFPRSETYGMVAQMRRAAVSVAANIVEGSSRNTPKDFQRFLTIAQGSAAELEYLLELSRDLGYVKPESAKSHRAEIVSIRRQLTALSSSLTNNQ